MSEARKMGKICQIFQRMTTWNKRNMRGECILSTNNNNENLANQERKKYYEVETRENPFI